MNDKSYIGKFEEIKHLSSQEQSVLLARARITAFSKLGLGGTFTAKIVLAVVTVFVLQAILYLWLSEQLNIAPFYIFVFIPLSIPLLMVFASIQHKRLVKKGLVSVLREEKAGG